MSDKNDMVFDDQSAERPLNLSSGDVDKKTNSAVKSLTGNNPRGELNTDDAQHMKKMRNYLIAFAGVNSMVNHHRQKVYKKAANNVTNAERKLRENQNHPGGSGSYGRSVAEIFAEDELKAKKERFEKVQRKYPDLQRPQSFRDHFNKMLHTGIASVKDVGQAQMHKNTVNAFEGSDVRATAAAEAAGYIPGSDIESDVQMQM